MLAALWTRVCRLARPTIGAGLICVGVAAALWAATGTVFGVPQAMIHITWGELDAQRRHAVEEQFHLSEPLRVGDSVWAYVPLDTSSTMLGAIVGHPDVRDTAGIDRKALRIRRPPLTPRRGGLWSGAPAGAARLWLLSTAALGALGVAVALLGVIALSGMTWVGTRRVGSAVLRLPGRAGASLLDAPGLVTALIFVGVVVFRLLSLDFFEDDHHTYLAYGYQTSLGELPVRDYDDPGFPLMIALSAIALRLGGMSLLPEAVMATTMLALAACVTWRATLLASAMPLLALGATALQVIAFPRLYSYPKILIAACAAYAFFACSRRPTRGTTMCLGFLTAVALLFRHDLAVYVGAASVLFLVLTHGVRRQGVAHLGIYAAACLICASPYLAYLVAFDITAHLQGAIGFSRAEGARTSEWGLAFLSRPLLSLALMALPLGVWAWLLTTRWRSGRWAARTPELAATALMLALIELVMLRDTTPTRLADIFGPAPVLLAWAGSEAVRSCRQVRAAAGRWLGYLAVAAVSLGLAYGTSQASQFPHQIAETRIADGWGVMSTHAREQIASLRDWPWGGMNQGSLEPLARYLDRCTPPDQSILVAGYLPQLSFLARRRFAGGHAWLLPGYFTSEVDQRRIAAWLAASPPSVVVVRPPDVANLSGYWPAIARLLDRYPEEYAFEDLKLLMPPATRPRAIDSETQLPCLR